MLAARIQARARRRLAKIRAHSQDVRYVQVMGRFLHEGLLVVNHPLRQHTQPVRVEDVLWAGQIEPRVLELLPALIVKKPALFVDVKALAGDLDEVVRCLKRDVQPPDFRGIPGKDVYQWLRLVGRKGKVPARLKSFRFRPEDQRLLEQLSEDLGVSESEVVRRGLRALA